MSEDFASLRIRIDTDGARRAEADLNNLEMQGKKTERATDGLRRSFSALALATAAVTAASVAMVRNKANEAKEIKNLARVAKTSVEEFQAMAFATETVGVSAQKLADVSKDVQDKIGDFIATGGGEFADFFENIAPKVGITAEQLAKLSGPDALIAVKKAMDDANVSANEQIFYLESLANDVTLLNPLLENNGKLFREQANRARELGVVLSEVDQQKLLDAADALKELDGAFDGLTKRVSVALAPVLETAAEFAKDFTVNLSDAIDSGEFEATVDAMISKFDGFGQDFADTLDITQKIYAEWLENIGGEDNSITGFLTDAIKYLPENIRTMVQIITTGFAWLNDQAGSYFDDLMSLVDKTLGGFPDLGRSYLGQLVEIVANSLGLVVDVGFAVGKAVKSALDPFSDDAFDVGAELDAIVAKTAEKNQKVIDGAKAEREAIRKANGRTYEEIVKQGKAKRKAQSDAASELIDSYLEENAQAKKNFAERLQEAADLGAEYDELKKRRQDALAGNDDAGEPATVKPKYDESGVLVGATEAFHKLVDSLRSQEEAIAESYQRRKAIILANTKENSEAQKNLLDQLKADFADQVLFDGGFTFNIDVQLDELKRQLEERKALILENAELTTTEKHALIEELELQHQQRMKDAQAEHDELMLEMNGTFWEKWLAAAEENLMSMDELAARTIENFANGFGNAFESMVFDSDSFGDAFANLMEGIARSSINALGQMAGQWLAYQLVQATTKKTAAAGAAGALTAEAQAASLMSGIHAFKSTAAIPVTGPAMAPAAMGAALAVTQPMAAGVAGIAAGMVGMAHDGIDSIPKEGTWLLDKGERVVDQRTNEDLKRYLKETEQRRRTDEAMGEIAQQSQNTSQNGQDTPPMVNNTRIVNVIDPSIVEDYLGSDAGERVIMNVVKSNPDIVRSLAG